MHGTINGCAPPPARASRFHLWTRRERWGLTWSGRLLATLLVLAATAAWWLGGESFLSLTERPPPDVLVVEGWVGNTGVRAAAAEFFSGHYRCIVATGGLTSGRWDAQQWSYAEMARRDLLAAGIPAAAVLLAEPEDAAAQRTFHNALASAAALRRAGIVPRHVTVFTLGAHARRSRLVFARALPSDVTVGVIAWRPSPDYDGPWWRSSDRAEDLLKESVGYALELARLAGRFLVRFRPYSP